MPPAKTLRAAYNAVDPTQPLPSGDERYINLNDVRGNEDTVRRMFISVSFSDKPTHQLFTGHRGCGKSTELLRLKKQLEDDKFCVVYFEVDKFLDPNDLIYTDLLLSIARRVVEDFSDEKKEIQLKSEIAEALKPIESWFREVVYTEDEWSKAEAQLESEVSMGIGLPGYIPLIGRLFAKFTGQIKTGDDIKTEIRQRLDKQISQLIEHLNNLISKIDVTLRKRGMSGLVIIVDNLDRMARKILSGESGKLEERTSHDALFIEHGEQLNALQCHTIYTVPISMMYAKKATILLGVFPSSYILPMIKIHEPQAKGGGEVAAGIERLKNLINQRLEIATLADADAIDYLCHACGGHPRDLMTLIRQSIEYTEVAESAKITQAAAVQAEKNLVGAFSRMIPDAHYAKLARVYHDNKVRNDDDYQTMLYNLSVLEYANGQEPWHDVHPAVSKLEHFQRALIEAEEKQETTQDEHDKPASDG